MLDMAILLLVPLTFCPADWRAVWPHPPHLSTPPRMNILLAAFTRPTRWVMLAWKHPGEQTTVRPRLHHHHRIVANRASQQSHQRQPEMRSWKPSNHDWTGSLWASDLPNLSEFVGMCEWLWVASRLFLCFFSCHFPGSTGLLAVAWVHWQPQVASGAPWSNSGWC